MESAINHATFNNINSFVSDKLGIFNSYQTSLSIIKYILINNLTFY
ncbi:MAG: hypothetical protein ACRC1M_00910 [Methanobacteriaceae archaeon]